MDIISIIVPVYKVEKYLERCINSILNQTYHNIEIILVDDGSPDGCPKLCDILSKRHKNIRVIHKKNQGLSSARNTGIDFAKGKYISFIDSDDFVEKDMIRRLYEGIKKYDADLSMLQYLNVDKNEKLPSPKIKKEIVYKGKSIEEAFLKLKIDSVCVGLYSKELIGEERFHLGKTSEDIPFNFSIFKKANTFVYIPEKRYYYFYNPDSISNGCLDENMLNYLRYRKEICDFYQKNDNDTLKICAEALYARAAMGLQARLILYSVDVQLNEEDCINLFSSVFNKYKNSFFKENTIPVSRKISAIFIFNMYKILIYLRRMKK